MTELPQDLVGAINRGECTAFVGAGFSGGAIPTWRSLLVELAGSLPEGRRETITQFLGDSPSALDYEAAAQTLRDGLGDGGFRLALRNRLGAPPRNPVIDRRLEWLRGIPFRSILTTNFDGFLKGAPPGGRPTSRSCAVAGASGLRRRTGIRTGRGQWWSSCTGTSAPSLRTSCSADATTGGGFTAIPPIRRS